MQKQISYDMNIRLILRQNGGNLQQMSHQPTDLFTHEQQINQNQDIQMQMTQQQDIQSQRVRQTQRLVNQQLNKPLHKRVYKKQFFEGKLSMFWIFVINDSDILDLIKSNPTGSNCLEIPMFFRISEAFQFLRNSSEKSLFKIVIDLQNAEDLIKIFYEQRQIYEVYQNKIVEIYVFDNNKQKQFNKLFQVKDTLKKLVKAIFTKQKSLLKFISKYIENDQQIINNENSNQGQYIVHSKNYLPTFIKLSGEDKTEVTQYRRNLYGAIKLINQQERRQKLKEFLQLVNRQYGQYQEQNILQYENINHVEMFTDENDIESKHKMILKFYKLQSFYYKVMNQILRFCRSIEQFKPITIPFNQNYLAIKYFYNKAISTNNNIVPALTLYRKAPVKKKNLQMLKVGNFIQLLGFVSTSKSKQFVQNWLLKNLQQYLFVIVIKQRTLLLTQQYKQLNEFDHGFVDYTLFNELLPQGYNFQDQQQVLLNALNVYKVIQPIPELQSSIDSRIQNDKIIYLEYSPMNQIYIKHKQGEKITAIQKNLLQNYRFCMKMYNQIQDDGDILRAALQFQKCKQHYSSILSRKNPETDIKFIQNKLAEAQFLCGETENSRLSAIESLKESQKQQKLLNQQIQGLEMDSRLKLVSLYEKNTQILQVTQDTLMARKSINLQLQLVKEQQCLNNPELLLIRCQTKYSLAVMYLIEGNFINAQKELKASESLILGYRNTIETQKSHIQWKFKKKKFKKRWFCSTTHKTIQDIQQQQLQSIEQNARQYNQSKQKFQQLLLKINDQMIKLSKLIGDRQLLQSTVIKSESYLSQIQLQPISSDIFKIAPRMIIQAKVQFSSQKPQQIENSYKLVESVIYKIEQVEPMNQKVAQYSKLLGQLKLHNSSKVMSISENQQAKSEKMNPSLNETERKRQYQDIKQSFDKALSIISFHHSNSSIVSFEVKNRISELQYTHSKLKQSHSIAMQVLKDKLAHTHTEGHKSAYILSKIHLTRGQLKFAFNTLQKSQFILFKSIVKQQDNEEYVKLYISSPLFIQSQLLKVKIFNRQLKHDLALKCVKSLQKNAKQKLTNFDGVSYLANIYEEYAKTMLYHDNYIQCQNNYLKCIKLRQKQMGKYNTPNAICYCDMFNSLINVQGIKKAKRYLKKAEEIFLRFPSNHPCFWIYQASTAFLYQILDNKIQQIHYLDLTIQLFEKFNQKNNITYLILNTKRALALGKIKNIVLVQNMAQIIVPFIYHRLANQIII